MTVGGLWFDLLLLTLLVAALAALYWVGAARRPYATAAEGGSSGFLRRLWYYPRLTRQAGYDPATFAWVYWATKLLLLLLLPLILLQLWWFVGGPPVVLLIALAILGFFLPDLWLAGARRARQRKIRASLSYFLDMMAALLHSGLNVEQAFRRTGREAFEASHPLAQEIAVIGREIEAGRDRAEAFDELAERTGVPELRSTAAALRAGLRLGAPVAETLEAQADLLRAKRREDARREINLAAVKALLPLLLTGFPLFLVVVFYPTGRELFDFLNELAALFN